MALRANKPSRISKLHRARPEKYAIHHREKKEYNQTGWRHTQSIPSHKYIKKPEQKQSKSVRRKVEYLCEMFAWKRKLRARVSGEA